jgi:hypothetical protein
MQTDPWIEVKRTDFLAALKVLKPANRIRIADRELQIGYVDQKVVFTVDGGSSVKPAQGDWPGLAMVKLMYFLTFLAAKPVEEVVRISYVDGRIHASSGRLAAQWSDNVMLSNLALHADVATPPSGHVVKFKCPKCRRMQGMAFDSLFSGSMAKASIKTMVDAGVRKGHGFGCLVCGHTWANQVL